MSLSTQTVRRVLWSQTAILLTQPVEELLCLVFSIKGNVNGFEFQNWKKNLISSFAGQQILISIAFRHSVHFALAQKTYGFLTPMHNKLFLR